MIPVKLIELFISLQHAGRPIYTRTQSISTCLCLVSLVNSDLISSHFIFPFLTATILQTQYPAYNPTTRKEALFGPRPPPSGR